ncbi:MAG: GNAT family N-acetyltransferase [Persicimonas sp.]
MNSLSITTKRLELRPFQPDDVDDVHLYASDPVVTRHTDWGPNTLDDTRAFVQEAIDAVQATPLRTMPLAIEHRESRRVIGTVGLQLVQSELGDGSIGFCMNRDFWGRGLATEAAGALLDWAVEEFQLPRIYATCRPDNHASARVLEKLGMGREGRLRKNIKVAGQWRDSLLYACVLSEAPRTSIPDARIDIELARGPDHVAACEQILRSLPAWFGIEEAIVEYVEKIGRLPTFVARTDCETVGFVSIERHSDAAAEIIVMAVAPSHHRRGAGRTLIEASEKYLRDQGVEFLQVKTLSDSHDSAEYARTRRFYRAVGFKPLQEFPSLWDEANPCLQMVKWLG